MQDLEDAIASISGYGMEERNLMAPWDELYGHKFMDVSEQLTIKQRNFLWIL